MTRNWKLLGVALVVAGCGDDPANTSKATFVTYNVGLAAGFVDYAPQRQAPVAELVGSLDADVVCLQEVWSQDDYDAIEAATLGAFPHQYYELTVDTAVGPPSCSVAESEPLLTCVQASCGEIPASELAGCAIDACGTEFGGLGDECQGCVVANLGQEVDVIIDTCRSGSARFSYGGANGLMLLSRHPIESPTHTLMDSSTVQRSVLAATIVLPASGAVDVYCTHLAADLSGQLEYKGEFGSYEGENSHQAGQLIDGIATRDAGASPAATTVVLGDFNSGPASEGVDAELPDASYAMLTDAGFVAWPTAAGMPECTYCGTNTLNAPSDAATVIDHVFVRGSGATTGRAVARIGLDTITIDVGGEPLETHPSDHYGTTVTLDLPAE